MDKTYKELSKLSDYELKKLIRSRKPMDEKYKEPAEHILWKRAGKPFNLSFEERLERQSKEGAE